MVSTEEYLILDGALREFVGGRGEISRLFSRGGNIPPTNHHPSWLYSDHAAYCGPTLSFYLVYFTLLACAHTAPQKSLVNPKMGNFFLEIK
jgi:hypothetical protein